MTMRAMLRDFYEQMGALSPYIRKAAELHIEQGQQPDLITIVYSFDAADGMDSTLCHAVVAADGSPDVARVLRALVVAARQLIEQGGGGVAPDALDDLEALMHEGFDAQEALRSALVDRTRKAHEYGIGWAAALTEAGRTGVVPSHSGDPLVGCPSPGCVTARQALRVGITK